MTVSTRRLPATLVLSGVALITALVVLSFIALSHGAEMLPYHKIDVAQPTLTGTYVNTHSAIYRENQQPGTGAWQLDRGTHIGGIQGYAGQVSALPGDHVPLYISTSKPENYQLAVYRIGWYQGAGAKLYATATNLRSRAQGMWDPSTSLLHHCTTCAFDGHTHEMETHWAVSYTLAIGTTWPSGVYLIKMTSANHDEGYIMLVMGSAHSHADALVNLPINTYQAYNRWGGYSLYLGGMKRDYTDRAVKVSFDRPYDTGAGTADFLSWDLQSIRWLEHTGLDMSYTTDVDVAANPALLLQHRLYLDLGHDEYWTKSMRDGVEAARDQGVSLAFFGANDSFWQARLEPDSQGTANRVLVCYKVYTHPHVPSEQLTRDPEYGHHNDIVTANWSDPVIHRSEEYVLGLHYGGKIGIQAPYPDWVVEKNAPSLLLEGTSLHEGSTIRGGLVGYEYDMPAGDAVAHSMNVVIIAQSPVLDHTGKTHFAGTGYYVAKSGAFVFDAGSIYWGWALDPIAPVGAARVNALRGSPSIQRLMANVLTEMLHDSPQAPR